MYLDRMAVEEKLKSCHTYTYAKEGHTASSMIEASSLISLYHSPIPPALDL